MSFAADVDVLRRASLRSVVFRLELVALAFYDKGHSFPQCKIDGQLGDIGTLSSKVEKRK